MSSCLYPDFERGLSFILGAETRVELSRDGGMDGDIIQRLVSWAEGDWSFTSDAYPATGTPGRGQLRVGLPNPVL